MEFVAETLQFQSSSGLVHDLDSAGEDVECLDGLMLDLLMLDECSGLLGAAQKYVHDLLGLY